MQRSNLIGRCQRNSSFLNDCAHSRRHPDCTMKWLRRAPGIVLCPQDGMTNKCVGERDPAMPAMSRCVGPENLEWNWQKATKIWIESKCAARENYRHVE